MLFNSTLAALPAMRRLRHVGAGCEEATAASVAAVAGLPLLTTVVVPRALRGHPTHDVLRRGLGGVAVTHISMPEQDEGGSE